METIVIGHKNPDMDSICSAIAYAELKRRQGHPRVIAGRAGNLNARIEFVLARFGVPEPVHFTDVTPLVRDVMVREVISARADATVTQAVGSLDEYQLRGLPVVDDSNRCLGLLSAHKISHRIFPSRGDAERARRVLANLADVLQTFDGELLVGEAPRDEEPREYHLTLSTMKVESFLGRLRTRAAERQIVFVGDREDVQLAAIEGRVRAIVIVGGLPIAAEVLSKAAEAGVIVARSRHDAATTVLLARGASRIGEMVDREFVSYSPDTPLDAARARATGSASIIFPVLDAERRIVGVMTKSDFLKPVPRQLILVDHNEAAQMVPGAEYLTILEVLDHHRLGGFKSDSPVLFWNNPVGSTSTIVALCYETAGVAIDPKIAGLLMAGLISDTLNLTSPTSTPTDARILKKLSEIAGVTADQLAQEIFAVGSPLKTLTPDEVVTADCKEFAERGAKFSVAQIEELGFELFHEKREEIAQALEKFRSAHGLLYSALLVTDINTQNSLLLVTGDEKFRKQIDYPVAGSDLWELEGVVSRKKQLLPYLLQCLGAMQTG
jgi:manganese-dependent inorganic pyrophosphatase